MEQFIMDQLLILNNTYVHIIPEEFEKCCCQLKYLGLGETGILLLTKVWNFGIYITEVFKLFQHRLFTNNCWNIAKQVDHWQVIKCLHGRIRDANFCFQYPHWLGPKSGMLKLSAPRSPQAPLTDWSITLPSFFASRPVFSIEGLPIKGSGAFCIKGYM